MKTLQFLASAVLLWTCSAALLPAPWWSTEVESALTRAGTHRSRLEPLLAAATESQREPLAFLVQHMPETDLQSIDPGLLSTNTALALEALSTAPWAGQIPRELFLNDILPYACVNEARENWRPRLRELALPLVEGCKTPSEAARRLNERLFPLVNVKYSTKRRRPDQGPLETMESGMATCTGLSILLVDACRAVGIPARVVGTPLWANLRGNHTWVEIWDGDWHFAGAAEPDPAGLNRGWFVHDASQARKDEPRHAIYASSFKPTGTAFPMVWARSINWVPAFNVTDRYTPKAAPAEAGKVRLLVKVLDRPAGQRVKADVTLADAADPARTWSGSSREETADMNDILPFEVVPGRTYLVTARIGDTTAQTRIQARAGGEQVVVLPLSDRAYLRLPSQACYAPSTNDRVSMPRYLVPKP